MTDTMETRELAWLQMPAGEVQHAVPGGEPRSCGAALCGQSPAWFDPDGWKKPKATRKCRRCVKASDSHG